MAASSFKPVQPCAGSRQVAVLVEHGARWAQAHEGIADDAAREAGSSHGGGQRQTLARWVDDGRLKVHIKASFALAEAAKAHQRLTTGVTASGC